MSVKQKDYSKIGGWLYLIAIGVFCSPLVLFSYIGEVSIYYDEFPRVIQGIYDDYITAVYALVVTSFVVIYAFVTKKKYFPKLYAALVVLGSVVGMGTGMRVQTHFPSIEVLSAGSMVRLAVSACAVFYLFISNRSKNTFVK